MLARKHRARRSLLAAAAVALAACGGAAGVGAPPPAPSGVSSEGSPTASSVEAAPSSAKAPAPPASSPPPSSSAPAPGPPTSLAPAEMKMPAASAFGADLTALGIDPKNLPPIEKLEPRALRGVMKLMAKSLGVRCADCHQIGDFAAPTRRKKIAARMWNELASKLTLADGSAVFCDSCHQGRIRLLDRSDKKALGKWMQAGFVDGIARKDGQPQKCENCHAGWDMTFLTAWGR